jgi:hypothetical protein
MTKKQQKPKKYATGGEVEKAPNYDESFYKALNSTENPYTYGFGGEKLYDFGGSKDGGVLAYADPNTLNPTSDKWQGNVSGGDNPDNLDAKTLRFLKSRGMPTNLYGVNKWITSREEATGKELAGTISSSDQARGAMNPWTKKSTAGFMKSGLGKIIVPAALSLLAGPAGAALGSTLGISTAAGTALAGAGLGAAGGAVTGGGLKGALLGAAMGGVGGYVGGGGLSNGMVKATHGPMAGQWVTTGTLNTAANAAMPSAGWFNTVGSGLSNVASPTTLQKLASTIDSKYGSGASWTDKVSNLGKMGNSVLGDLQKQPQQQQSAITQEQFNQWIASLTQGNPQGGDKYLQAYGVQRRAKGGLIQQQPRLVKGPGDGMSDSIQTSIDGEAPALLSDSEHVTPALQVALLGRGSSDAGSSRISQLIDEEIKRMYGGNVDAKKLQQKAMMPKKRA